MKQDPGSDASQLTAEKNGSKETIKAALVLKVLSGRKRIRENDRDEWRGEEERADATGDSNKSFTSKF